MSGVPISVESVEAAQRDRKCVCQVGPGFEDVRGAQSIVLAGPGDDSSTICPDCGRYRIVMRLAFDPRVSDRH